MQKNITDQPKALDMYMHRFFEVIPGILTWTLLLSPFWLGLLAPKILIFYITFLTVYWFYLGFKLAYGVIIGYYRHKKEMSTDWYAACKALDFSMLPDKLTLPSSLDETKLFILSPCYSESKTILSESFAAILNQTFSLKNVVLVYSVEEKYSERVLSDLHEITDPHAGLFSKILFYVHPQNIEGEARGVAGANRNWGAKHAVSELFEAHENLRNYLFLTYDADSVLDKQFLSRLVHLYLTSDKRDNKFYSTAVHLFNNNIWNVPMLMRIEANMVTLGSLSDWVTTSKRVKDTFSCYAASLNTLIAANYWDSQLGIDDTIFYWRAFFARNGDFEGAEHYIPYSADAVQAETYAKSHVSMYKQLLRWGWGVISLPLSMTEFLKRKNIPFSIKLHWFIKHIEMKVVMITVVFLMTFGISLATLINPHARQLNLVYSLPNLMSMILTFTMFLLIPVTYYRLALIKPMPKNWNILKKFLVFMEGPLVIVNLFTYSFLPWIEAQTRMMLGKKMVNLHYTQKQR